MARLAIDSYSPLYLIDGSPFSLKRDPMYMNCLTCSKGASLYIRPYIDARCVSANDHFYKQKQKRFIREISIMNFAANRRPCT